MDLLLRQWLLFLLFLGFSEEVFVSGIPRHPSGSGCVAYVASAGCCLERNKNQQYHATLVEALTQEHMLLFSKENDTIHDRSFF